MKKTLLKLKHFQSRNDDDREKVIRNMISPKLNLHFYGSPVYGNINLSIGLAQALVKTGHSVTYHTGSHFQKYIEQYDIPFSSSSDRLTQERFFAEKMLIALREAEIFLSENLEKIKQTPPDCIICNFVSFDGILIAKILDIPLIVVQGIAVEETFKNFLFDSLLFRYGTQEQEKVWSNELSEILKRIGSRYGISLLDFIFKYGFTENQDSNVVNLVTTSRHFLGEMYSKKPNYYYVGPLSRSPMHEDISSYYKNGTNNASKPVLLISLGTNFPNNQKFLDCCVEALGDIHADIFYSTGHAKLNTSRIAKNFLVSDFFPQTELLKVASAFVTHGGMNSLYESVLEQVPCLFCPQAAEQLFNAERMKELGAGLLLKNKEDQINPRRMKESVDILLNKNYKMKENIFSLDQSFSEAGGNQRAVNIIEKFCASRTAEYLDDRS